MQVKIDLDPPPAITEALSEGIVGFNRLIVPDLEPNEAEVRFFVVATNDDGQLVGGLRGACYWNTLHIELLWLSDDARGSGTGAKIMAAAEGFARKQGCGNAMVETTSWQARPFYERQGYTLMATLPDRPKGHATHYLSKALSAPA